jgi:hypothetical protein
VAGLVGESCACVQDAPVVPDDERVLFVENFLACAIKEIDEALAYIYDKWVVSGFHAIEAEAYD